MEEQSVKNQWYGRLAIIFLFLFAVLWSLGSFFFWILLGLSSWFIFLWLYSSGIKFPTQAREPRRESTYSSYRPEPSPSGSADAVIIIRKIVRTVLIIFAGMIAFFFLIGIFVGKNEDATTSETIEGTPIINNDVSALNDRGNEFFDDNKYDSALKYYEKVLAIDPLDQYGMYNKGLVFFMKQEYRKSIKLTQECLHEHPDFNVAWWLLGDNYFSLQQYDSSLYALERGYSKNYREPGFLQLMGDVYLKKDNRMKAKELYLQVIEQDTTQAEVYRHLAELDPSHAELYRMKARALDKD